MRSLVVTSLAVLALVAGVSQAAAAGEPPKQPPTELWNAFPLDPQPTRTDRAALERVSSRRALPPREEKSWVVISVLAALIAVAATFSVRPRLAVPLMIAVQRKTRSWWA